MIALTDQPILTPEAWQNYRRRQVIARTRESIAVYGKTYPEMAKHWRDRITELEAECSTPDES